MSKHKFGNRKSNAVSGSNPNRMKLRVVREFTQTVKSKTQTPQVDKPVRKY